MIKKKDLFLKEFVRSLNNEEIRFATYRLSQRIGSDLSEVVEFLQSFIEIDRFLISAETSFGFYDMLDELEEYLEREVKRRLIIERVEI